MTSRITSQAKVVNKTLHLCPIYSSITSPKVFPLCLIETMIDEKSWTPPKNIQPITIHKNTGNQPKTAAWIGPVIGSAPAIEAKWS